jgi:hypothetical protein
LAVVLVDRAIFKDQEQLMNHRAQAVRVEVHELQVPQPMQEPLAQLDKDLLVATVEPTLVTTRAVAAVELVDLVVLAWAILQVEQAELDCNLA